MMDQDTGPRPDFFVSYTAADQPWAEWIAYTLEAKGYSCVIQAWDFRPGGNFVVEMQRAASRAGRTITVLSAAYLRKPFPASEWAAAFADDPEGLRHKLVPVRIDECRPEGLLRAVIHIDLVGLDEAAAAAALLRGLASGRAKPAAAPPFPGAGPKPATTRAPPFPGGRAGRDAPAEGPRNGDAAGDPLTDDGDVSRAEPTAAVDQAAALLAALRAAASLGDRLERAQVEALAAAVGVVPERLPDLVVQWHEAKQVRIGWGGGLEVLPPLGAGPQNVLINAQGATFGHGTAIAGDNARGGNVTKAADATAAFGALATVVLELGVLRPTLQGEAAEVAAQAEQALRERPAPDAPAEIRRGWADRAGAALAKLLQTAPQVKALVEVGERAVKALA